MAERFSTAFINVYQLGKSQNNTLHIVMPSGRSTIVNIISFHYDNIRG